MNAWKKIQLNFSFRSLENVVQEPCPELRWESPSEQRRQAPRASPGLRTAPLRAGQWNTNSWSPPALQNQKISHALRLLHELPQPCGCCRTWTSG